jgi:D-glycero-D-manno-heptose 1,7-bisphosphate phosphatase
VQPFEGVKAALDRLRTAGIKVGVVTNQSGVGRGMITLAQVHAVNERVEALLGPFDGWYICPHAPDDVCDCRKPSPKLVLQAAREWNLDPREIAVIGDKPSDEEAARTAGARGFVIPDGSAFGAVVNALLRR